MKLHDHQQVFASSSALSTSFVAQQIVATLRCSSLDSAALLPKVYFGIINVASFKWSDVQSLAWEIHGLQSVAKLDLTAEPKAL